MRLKPCNLVGHAFIDASTATTLPVSLDLFVKVNL